MDREIDRLIDREIEKGIHSEIQREIFDMLLTPSEPCIYLSMPSANIAIFLLVVVLLLLQRSR